MDKNENLIIFTTSRLGNKPRDLFVHNQCELIPINPEQFPKLSTFWKNQNSELFNTLYRRNNTNIFAYHTYSQSKEDRFLYIQNLISEIYNYLGFIPKRTILFAHGIDINESDKYFEEINENKIVEIIGNELKSKSDFRIVAFKHEQTSPVFNLLSKFDDSIKNFIDELTIEKSILKYIEFHKAGLTNLALYNDFIKSIDKTEYISEYNCLFWNIFSNEDIQTTHQSSKNIFKAYFNQDLTDISNIELKFNEYDKFKETYLLNPEKKHLIIAFISAKELDFRNIYKTFETLNRISDCKTVNFKNQFLPVPILLITDFDFTTKDAFEKQKLKPYINFFDSNIWHYTVFYKKENTEQFINQLNDTIKKVNENYKLNLYHTNISKEFLEYQSRMLVNSYLVNIGQEGHAGDVIPMYFHSEQFMKIRADEELKKLLSKKLKWRFLLIDDYAEKDVIIGEKSNNLNKIGTEATRSKNLLIDNILKNDNVQSSTHTVLSIQSAIDKLKGNEQLKGEIYDILLLDYLLDYIDEKDETKGREFGHELLEKINEDYKLKANKGPLNMYWIFPITVFSQSLFERMRKKGLSHINENWFIDRGADPINTPQLFRYNLYKFMNLQINQSLYSTKEIIEFLQENPVIRAEEAKDEHRKDDEIRLWAKSVFGAFIHRFGKREVIELDKEKGSVLAKSIWEFLHDNPGIEFRFYDHVRQLLYLLAYGSGFHATQMWELSNFVEYEIFERNSNKEYSSEFNQTFKHYIPNYITNLTKLNS